MIDVLPYAILANTNSVFQWADQKRLCNEEELHVLFSMSEEENPFTFTVFVA